ANNRLYSLNKIAAGNDRIIGQVRRGSVSAFAFYFYFEVSSSGLYVPFAIIDFARLHRGHDMDAEHMIDAIQAAVLDHLYSSAWRFLFRMLMQNNHLPPKLILHFDQSLAQNQHVGGMPIMAAGMHNTRVRRGERKACLLHNRKRIKIGANSYCLPWFPAIDRNDDSISAYIVTHITILIGIKISDILSCILFVKR